MTVVNGLQTQAAFSSCEKWPTLSLRGETVLKLQLFKHFLLHAQHKI